MALVSQYARELNCLKDNQKSIRLPALQRLHSEILKQSLSEVQIFFSQHLKKSLLDLVSDPVDKCRELTINLLTQFAQHLPDMSSDAIDVLEAIARRLTASPMAETGESQVVEEIRLMEVRLVKEVVKRWWQVLPPALNDLGHLVAKAFMDPFPQVKHVTISQEAAELLLLLCKETGLRIGLCAQTICVGALENLTHQHSKVRVNTLTALGVLLEKTGNTELLKVLFSVLKQKLRYDRTAAVRAVLYEIIRDWLLSFPYESLTLRIDLDGKGIAPPASTEAQLVYFLLSGLGDPDPTITEKIPSYLASAGNRRAALSQEFSEDTDLDRVGDSSQYLILNVLKELVQISLADCSEWTVHEQSKTRGAIALFGLAKFAQHQITPHLEKIAKSVIKCYTESEDPYQKQAYDNLIGTLSQTCEYDIVATVLVKNLAPDQSSPSQRTTVYVSSI